MSMEKHGDLGGEYLKWDDCLAILFTDLHPGSQGDRFDELSRWCDVEKIEFVFRRKRWLFLPAIM